MFRNEFSFFAYLLLGFAGENDIIFADESNEDICEEERMEYHGNTMGFAPLSIDSLRKGEDR